MIEITASRASNPSSQILDLPCQNYRYIWFRVNCQCDHFCFRHEAAGVLLRQCQQLVYVLAVRLTYLLTAAVIRQRRTRRYSYWHGTTSTIRATTRTYDSFTVYVQERGY